MIRALVFIDPCEGQGSLNKLVATSMLGQALRGQNFRLTIGHRTSSCGESLNPRHLFRSPRAQFIVCMTCMRGRYEPLAGGKACPG